MDVGSNFSLKCSSSGNPRPEYLWNYYQTSNVDEKREDGVTHLSITNATADNMGLYTCVARNNFGNVSKTVKVTVTGRTSFQNTFTMLCIEANTKYKVLAHCKKSSLYILLSNFVLQLKINSPFKVDGRTLCPSHSKQTYEIVMLS